MRGMIFQIMLQLSSKVQYEIHMREHYRNTSLDNKDIYRTNINI